MPMKITRQNSLLIAAAIVVLGAAAYFMWTQQSVPDTVTVMNEGPISGAQATFLNLIVQLEPIGFNPAVLTDPRFLSLVDIHVGIVPEAPGRVDPFAPL